MATYTFEPTRLENSSTPDVSPFGTPVRDAIEFLAGNYRTPKGVNNFDGIVIQDCIIDAERVKNIVTTQTVGEAGEYVEFIGNGNYTISMQLNLNDVQGAYPEEAFATLNEILNAPAVIDVSCQFLNRLGIFSIVVQRHSLTNSGNWQNQQLIQVEALQFINLELKRK